MISMAIPEAEVKFAMRSGVVDLITVIPTDELDKGIAFIRTLIINFVVDLYEDEEDDELEVAYCKLWDQYWDNYFCPYWLREQLVKVWNVSGLDVAEIQLKNLTSNGLERYNRHFNAIVPTSHPNLAVFASTLHEEADGVVQRIENTKKRREIVPEYKAAVLLEIPEEYVSFRFKGVDTKKKSKRARGKKK